VDARSISTALEALQKAMNLRNGGDSHEWFLLAVAYSLKGDSVQARRWYDKAVLWMESNLPNDQELRSLRAESASLLGRAN
jgi:Tfp pilus assembly protein PilF